MHLRIISIYDDQDSLVLVRELMGIKGASNDDKVRLFLNQLSRWKSGFVTTEQAMKFGVKSRKGILITKVIKDGPADMAGIKKGDIVKDYKISSNSFLCKLIFTSFVCASDS